MVFSSVFKTLNHNLVGFPDPLVPAAGFRNPKQHFSNFGPPLGASHFFQLPGSGTTPWRHPGKVAIFPWCSVCEVSARVFFTGRGWVHRLLFPYKKQNPHGPRLENLTVFDTVFFVFPLLVFCPLPSLDQPPSLLHVHVHVLVCHRDRHCAVCATHRHTLFSCSLSPMPSLEHTLCLDLSQRQRPSPQRGPKKLFRSRKVRIRKVALRQRNQFRNMKHSYQTPRKSFRKR